MSSVDGASAVPKVEPYDEDEFSDSDQEPDGQNLAQEVAQVQKRKGGRKPVGRFQASPRTRANPTTDLRYLGREKTEKPTSPGCVQRTTDRIYQTARDHHKTP